MGGFLCLSAAARRSPRISRIAPTALQASHWVRRRSLACISVVIVTPSIFDNNGLSMPASREPGSRCHRRRNQALRTVEGLPASQRTDPRMKLRAALAFAPLAQGFVPARTTAPRTAIIVRSEPIEINAPTVYSHWSANVNEEVFPSVFVNVLPAEVDRGRRRSRPSAPRRCTPRSRRTSTSARRAPRRSRTTSPSSPASSAAPTRMRGLLTRQPTPPWPRPPLRRAGPDAASQKSRPYATPPSLR